MKGTIHLQNGKYVFYTTRKANYSDQIFGKMTLWKNQYSCFKGECDGAQTITNIHLGNDKSHIKQMIDKFIDENKLNEKTS